MTTPLKEFVITVDKKSFIKCKNPKIRADFKWEKLKCKRYKMSDITIVEQIAIAIEENELGSYGEQQLCDVIDEVIDNPDVAREMAVEIMSHPGFPNLTPKQLRAIIRGYSSQIA